MTRGRFVWYDLMTTAPAAAIDFYGRLIGWETREWEGPMPYRLWVASGTPVGGIMELPEEARAAGAPPHWLAYVEVQDASATAARAAELGGTVLVPATDIPGAGRFTVLQDPQEAVFAAYQPAETGTVEEPQERQPGRFSWHELATTDWEAAFAFYSELFGWHKDEAMDMGPAGTYQLYGTAGGAGPLGGMFNKPAAMPVSMWMYYVFVDDVQAAVNRVTELGGTLLNGPMEVPGGEWIAQCLDPQGAAFALHSAPR
jgi:predicted enzyme related to lactoylglutathione lyase